MVKKEREERSAKIDRPRSHDRGCASSKMQELQALAKSSVGKRKSMHHPRWGTARPTKGTDFCSDGERAKE